MAVSRHAAFLVFLAAASTSLAQPCNLGCTPCVPNPLPPFCGAVGCKNAGCGNTVAMDQSGTCRALSPPDSGGGRLDFSGTQYAATCGNCDPSGHPCPVPMPPPLRFWQYDNYAAANIGCVDLTTQTWVCNQFRDQGLGIDDGSWVLNATWTDSVSCSRMDGCIESTPAVLKRAVVEFSDVTGSASIAHDSWYLIAAVDGPPFRFDLIKGGDTGASSGCSPAEIRTRSVPGLTIVGRTDPCINSSTPTSCTMLTTGQPGFCTVDILLDNPAPDYYTETGRNDLVVRLIDGYEILFMTGPEPTSSDPCAGWQPVLDPTDPRLIARRTLGTIPYGACAPKTVAVPAGVDVWLATRIVYADCSTNGSRVWSGNCNVAPSTTAMALLGSKVSGHCGPVR